MKANEVEQTKQIAVTKLAEALREYDLTASWAARRMGYTKQHVFNILNGVCDPSLEMALKMIEFAEKISSGLAS